MTLELQQQRRESGDDEERRRSSDRQTGGAAPQPPPPRTSSPSLHRALPSDPDLAARVRSVPDSSADEVKRILLAESEKNGNNETTSAALVREFLSSPNADATINQFLRAVGGEDSRAAVARLVSTLRWRKEANPGERSCEECKKVRASFYVCFFRVERGRLNKQSSLFSLFFPRRLSYFILSGPAEPLYACVSLIIGSRKKERKRGNGKRKQKKISLPDQTLKKNPQLRRRRFGPPRHLLRSLLSPRVSRRLEQHAAHDECLRGRDPDDGASERNEEEQGLGLLFGIFARRRE